MYLRDPLDREDIHNLICSLDDVLDYIDACAQRLNLYKIASTTEESLLLVEILVKSVQEVEQAVYKLRRLKGTETIMKNVARLTVLKMKVIP